MISGKATITVVPLMDVISDARQATIKIIYRFKDNPQLSRKTDGFQRHPEITRRRLQNLAIK
jgi:hypothetical protein